MPTPPQKERTPLFRHTFACLLSGLLLLAVGAPAAHADSGGRALASPGVAHVGPGVAVCALLTPQACRFGEQYGPPMIGAPRAWGAVGYGTSAVKVAVLDTGMRHGHQDLTRTSRFAATQ